MARTIYVVTLVTTLLFLSLTVGCGTESSSLTDVAADVAELTPDAADIKDVAPDAAAAGPEITDTVSLQPCPNQGEQYGCTMQEYGDKRCDSQNIGVETCSEKPEKCLAWTRPIECQPMEICQNAECVPAPECNPECAIGSKCEHGKCVPDVHCEDESCEEGSKRCTEQNDAIEECVLYVDPKYPDVGCYGWQVVELCESRQVCQNGEC